jgi:hypothetical protein
MGSFSVREGVTSFSAAPNRWLLFGAIVLGVVFHWLYEIVVAGIKKGGAFEFGSPGLIAGHLFISLIVAFPAYLSAYAQLSKADPNVRTVSAIVTGLGVDALVAPWTEQTPAVPG